MWLFVARIVLCLLPLEAAVTTAQAAPLVISAEGETRTDSCGGAAASIAGNRNVVTLTGVCTGLQIRGESNAVKLTLAPEASMDIEGNHNRVRYIAYPGGAPTLRVLGSFTEVAPALGAPAPAADIANLFGDNETITLDCRGKGVSLQGTHSHYRVDGACTSLTVKGEANEVLADLAPGAQVLIEGNEIALSYTMSVQGAEPNATISGIGSSITRLIARGTAGASSASTSVVAPTLASVPILMRDLGATVMEPGTSVLLTAPMFAGSTLSSAGEIQLSRIAQLINQINPSGLRLTGHDPADPMLSAQRTKLVRDWLQSHAGKTLPVQELASVADPGVDVMLLR